jgi:lysocardiolipin and lysophospholipid acyltransferase
MNGSNGSQEHHVSGEEEVHHVSRPILNNGPKHRPLTPMRRCRGVACVAVILSTAFLLIVYLAPITTFVVRLFSVHYSRKATSFLFVMWLSLWPFLFEKINKTKVVFSGENVISKRSVLIFAKHRTEVDWMYLWNLALRKGHLGYIKYILKSSLMKLPIFSWAFHIFALDCVDVTVALSSQVNAVPKHEHNKIQISESTIISHSKLFYRHYSICMFLCGRELVPNYQSCIL